VAELASRAAALFTVGFDGTATGAEIERLIARGVGGVVLFSRNVASPAQVLELTTGLKRHAARPLLVSVDQEGGGVARLREGFTPLPAFRAVGDAGDAALARAYGSVVGRELRAVGIDLDFAPVLDVDTNPENPVIGKRALGADPEQVAVLGMAFAAGLADAGVAACGKHFPGHGDTESDSHFELPRLPHGIERLERVELVPFRAAARAGIPAIMTAHVVFTALDPERPATMSQKVVSGLLRAQLGFDGVVFSDDLEMKAISDHYALEAVLLGGLEAGLDGFLVCRTPELAHRAIDTVAGALRRGVLPEARVLEAERRMARLSERFAKPPGGAEGLSQLASAEHRTVVARLNAAAQGAA
jgi:beta-N-acetylhexosaminidase